MSAHSSEGSHDTPHVLLAVVDDRVETVTRAIYLLHHAARITVDEVQVVTTGEGADVVVRRLLGTGPGNSCRDRLCPPIGKIRRASLSTSGADYGDAVSESSSSSESTSTASRARNSRSSGCPACV